MDCEDKDKIMYFQHNHSEKINQTNSSYKIPSKIKLLIKSLILAAENSIVSAERWKDLS